MYTIALIERSTPACDCWSILERKKKISELSVGEIVKKYQGFEGELISSHQVVSLEKELDIEAVALMKSKVLINNVLLIVSPVNGQLPLDLSKRFTFVGYEVGVFEEEKTIYSSVFNEILFGGIEELYVYKKHLNDALLFDDITITEEYINLHNDLSSQGKDIEDYEEMNIYKVLKYSS